MFFNQKHCSKSLQMENLSEVITILNTPRIDYQRLLFVEEILNKSNNPLTPILQRQVNSILKKRRYYLENSQEKLKRGHRISNRRSDEELDSIINNYRQLRKNKLPITEQMKKEYRVAITCKGIRQRNQTA